MKYTNAQLALKLAYTACVQTGIDIQGTLGEAKLLLNWLKAVEGEVTTYADHIFDNIPMDVDKVWDKGGDIWLRVGMKEWRCGDALSTESRMIFLYGPVTTQPKDEDD